jgi:hypothetical protein
MQTLKSEVMKKFYTTYTIELECEMSFDDFLTLLQMNEETYIKALRSIFKKPTIFMKKYFCKLFRLFWQANVDPQFILISYVTSYCISCLRKNDKIVTCKMQNM